MCEGECDPIMLGSAHTNGSHHKPGVLAKSPVLTRSHATKGQPKGGGESQWHSLQQDTGRSCGEGLLF